jgi:hypothetical protein
MYMDYYVYGVSPISFNTKVSIYEIIVAREIVLYQKFVPKALQLQETRVIKIENLKCSLTEIIRRYGKMNTKEKDYIEEIQSEIDDDYSDDSLFNISSWGADLSFRELISMYEDDELIKPELQRKYVWDKVEASRFIESILLGLPVPSIFLAQSGSQRLIVDGYQRIMTVYDYIRGIFSADKKVFKLSNSDKINVRWRNKAFSELSTDDQRKIKSTTIHAIIFEQKKPENDGTSLYQVFERINTSGRTLTPQEIRNCVYQGSFNTMLFKLNENRTWRELFGTEEADSRMRDLEYILRFFTMKTGDILDAKSKQISLKKSLNDFMKTHKEDSPADIQRFKDEFDTTVQLVYDHIGKDAFRNYTRGKFSKKFHPAIFDAIMVAVFLIHKQGIPFDDVSEEKHIALLENPGFKEATSKRTTDVENIRKRIFLAGEMLFGVDLK